MVSLCSALDLSFSALRLILPSPPNAVVACPCGIGLAAPTAAAVGLGLAAQKGILAQGGGTAFQAATKVDTVVFDKSVFSRPSFWPRVPLFLPILTSSLTGSLSRRTGTLTLGKPSVTDHDLLPIPTPATSLLSQKNAQSNFILSAVLQMEETSSHPLATALRSFATDQLLSYPSDLTTTAGSTEEIVGRGLKGVVVLSSATSGEKETFEVCIGNEAFMASLPASSPPGTDTEMVGKWQEEAKSIVLVAIKSLAPPVGQEAGYTLCARFAIADPPRPDAKATVERLRKDGKEVWMCSGDNEITAKAVARQGSFHLSLSFSLSQKNDVPPNAPLSHVFLRSPAVGIAEECVVASCLPSDKASHIHALQRLPSLSHPSSPTKKRFVLFTGDGLNDSVALAAADVGVAMGSGSQVSVASADFVLLNSNLESLVQLLGISGRVFRRTKLNFGWALVFNCVCLRELGVVFPLPSFSSVERVSERVRN